MQKVAFLFLTISNIYHELMWRDFFKGHEKQYSIYIHSKYPVTSGYFKPYEIPVKVPTTWESTMHAQVTLLKEALKNKNNQKFIFLSESTLLLQCFKKVYNTIIKTPYSQFKYYPNPHVNPMDSQFNIYRDLKPIPKNKQYKSSQWVLLNRKHAQLVVQDRYYISIISKYFADNEHVIPTLLAGQKLLHEIVNQDKTFVLWPCKKSPHPYEFTNLHSKRQWNILKRAINQGYLFARKFSSTCCIEPLRKELERQRLANA